MLRTSAVRLVPKPLFTSSISVARHPLRSNSLRTNFTAASRPRSPKAFKPLALAVRNPVALSLVRYQTTRSIDHDREARLAQKQIEPHPEEVSSDSTVRHVLDEEGDAEREPEVQMTAGIKQDFVSPYVAWMIWGAILTIG